MSRSVTDAEYRRLLEFRDGLRRFLRWSEEQAIAAGLTAAQHQLLLAVQGHAGPEAPTITDVAMHLQLRHHSVVGLVDRAERANLVARVLDASDHRIVRIVLTPLGIRRLEALSAAHLEELRRLTPKVASLWVDA
jgi:DNA-binding MarR family transcriptional regulator